MHFDVLSLWVFMLAAFLGFELIKRVSPLLHTPLMWVDKAGTWELASKIGGDNLIHIVQEHTHTCYMGDRTRRHDWGYGCGTCPACELRRQGWVIYSSGRGPSRD